MFKKKELKKVSVKVKEGFCNGRSEKRIASGNETQRKGR